jgi:hypothetical protein
MKYPHVIHTDFLVQLVDELNTTSCHIGARHHFTAKHLTDDYYLNLAHEMLEKEIQQYVEDLNYLYESEDGDPDEVDALKQCIDSTDKTITDLILLNDLEGAEYATPTHIAHSVEFLSERLVAQLQAKVLCEANYNEYYCRTLTDVLVELCELIKEV